ncbi:membrane dipeptidase [Sphingosinicella sp. GR2756]|uniref:Membrane dipeptidase n=2 Tax=Sphingosinicella rhizophila TaxID=3050082 RepID=A0ABU3Q9M3_9SPHN|nr:membrane dipeptidase [Sphingosinicella sp. GR2756]MDT9599809.1 membrane dipeptidase [Sphingosinicella sp. GR2756]
MAGPSPALAQRPAAGRWRNAIIVNALGGLSNPNVFSKGADSAIQRGVRRRRTLDARTLADAHASGVTAVNCTLGYVAGEGDPFEVTISDIANYDQMIRAQSRDLVKILTAADIVQAKRDRRIGLIYGFQNAVMVGDDPTRIDMFADLGVRIIQLTYNPANTIGDGSMAPQNRGLTPFGREVVERLNQNRIMVDLSHSGQRTCLEAARVSKQPISINHTGCRAITDLPRNKTDQELRLVADRGGFVGIYFMPFLDLDGSAMAEDVVRHIEHAVKVCGEDHVGIGTDGPVTQIDDLESYRERLAEEVAFRKRSGIGAAGEGPNTLPFVIDLRGPTQFHRLAELLRARGHSRLQIEKILGGNFLRHARTVWGG